VGCKDYCEKGKDEKMSPLVTPRLRDLTEIKEEESDGATQVLFSRLQQKKKGELRKKKGGKRLSSVWQRDGRKGEEKERALVPPSRCSTTK